MPATYVIYDCYHEYGMALIDRIEARYGLKPVCVFASTRETLHKRAFFPAFDERRAEAFFYLDRMSTAQLAATLRARFDVVGVVPYFEQSIAPMADLVEALHIPWNTPALLRRFRDKTAVKAHIAERAPSLDLGMSRLVRSAEDVLAGPRPARYVIKPNDGFANRDVGFFEASSPAEALTAYFGPHAGRAFTMETFFVGDEYAVNGQMDERGEPVIVNVIAYERIAGNGKPNLYHRTHHVRQTDPVFAPLADYAAAVMRATGLVRCPFHMELMHGPEGPRLIEIGARFGGTRYAIMANDVHGGTYDVFAAAAHHYLFDTAYPEPAPTWEHYNQVSYVHLDGSSAATSRIYTVAGLDAVEALPEFKSWVVRPRVGGMVQRTVDLYTVPYSVHLMAEGSEPEARAKVVAASEAVKRLVRINAAVSRVQRLRVDLAAKLHSVRMRGEALAARLLDR